MPVDEEEAAIGDAIVFFQDMEGARDCFVDIGDERIGNALDSPFGFWSIEPSGMGKAAIDGAADKLSISLFKFFELFLEGVKLCWTDEGKIKRIEEKNDVLAVVIGKRKIGDLSVDDSLRFKIRCFFSN